MQWWLSPDENAISEASKIQKCNSWFSLDENAIWDISEIIYQFPARHKFTMLRKRNQAISCSPYMELSVYLNRLRKSKNDVFKVTKCLISFCFFFVIPCDWCCPYCSDLAETRLKSRSPPLWLSVGQPAGTPLPLTSSQSDSVLVSQEIFLKQTQI